MAEDPIDLIHAHLERVAVSIDGVNSDVPSVVAQIVAKLMAKNAEDRYQSALGLKFDLELCLELWQKTGTISEFELGARDLSDRFTIPERLYGRALEVQTLLAAGDRVAAGNNELVLVAGFSGIGKTALINELHKPITRQHGYFIAGKFDQFNRNIPLSGFIRAFRDLTGQLASESDSQLADWRDLILTAVGENGRVLIEVIPELERIIGTQPPVAELSGTAAQHRFNGIFQKFIAVFTTAAHPLTIFLDDLQWADSASLESIELLMAGKGYLLILGAYRDNEVSPVHLLMLTIERLQKARKIVSTIALTPLNFDDTNCLVADTLHCPIDRSQPLTELIDLKTQGNPFFATQFLKALHQDGEIWFNPAGYWECEIASIHALALSDDIVEFMATQLQKLPPATQHLLELAACIGDKFDLETLAIVSQQSQLSVATALWHALQAGSILPTNQIYKFWQAETPTPPHPLSPLPAPRSHLPSTYRFLHDRFQQAAYSLIPAQQQQQTHLQIGRLLLTNTPAAQRGKRLFEIVNHLNLAICSIELSAVNGAAVLAERELLVQLNLDAAHKARAANAYAAAFDYAQIGVDLVGELGWTHQYRLTLALHETLTEAAFLHGDFEAVPLLAKVVLERAKTPLDRVKTYETIVQYHTVQKQYAAAIDRGLEILQQLGIKLSPQPHRLILLRELVKTKIAMWGKSSQQLLDLPEIADPEKVALLRILELVQSPAFFCSQELMAILGLVGVQLTLRYGNTPWAASFYGVYCITVSTLGELKQSYRLGRLAMILADRFDNLAIRSQVKVVGSWFCQPWLEALHLSIPVLDESLSLAIDSGNLRYIGLSAGMAIAARFYSGITLDRISDKVHELQGIISQSKDETSKQFMDLLWQTIINLQVTTNHPSDIVKDGKDRTLLLSQWQASNETTIISTMYGFQAFLAYLFEDIPNALIYADAQIPYEYSTQGGYVVTQNWMFDALIRLAVYHQTDREVKKKLLKRVDKILYELQKRARLMPANFQHKYDLVEAEKCRVFGNFSQAIELYDRAISGAKTNQFLQEEAIANELAAKFYVGWGKAKIAATYMQDAYYCYAKWGAIAKIDDLERRYPQLLAPILQLPSQPTTANFLSTLSKITNGAQAIVPSSKPHTFDLVSAIQTAQTLASIIELPELLERSCQVLLEHSGAQICIPILRDLRHATEGHSWQVYQIVRAADRDSSTLTRTTLTACDYLPQKLIHSVINRPQTTIIDWETIDPGLLTDDYLSRYRPQSAMCLPLIDRGELQGLIYLEHRDTSGIFIPNSPLNRPSQQQIILEFLASQAAIALTNAQLYESVVQRSAAIEASLDGFAILDNDRFIYLNQSHADMFGYTIGEMLDLDWHCLYTPDQIQAFETTAFPAVSQFGQWRGEAIATRKDGTTFDEEVTLFLLDNGQFIWIRRDITDRKLAERNLKFTQFAIDNSTDGISWLRSDGSFAYANKSMCRMLGYSFNELCSLHIWDIDDETSPQTWPNHWRKLKASGGFSVETHHQRKDRSRYPVEISLNFFEFEGEEYNFTRTRDVTDAKAAELALRQSEASYQKLADNIPGAIYQLRMAPDGSFSYPYISSVCEELFQISAAAVMADANCLLQMVHPDDFADFQRIMAASSQHLIPKLWEGRAVLGSGEIKWIKSASRPELQSDGSIVWDGILLDITAQQAALRERQRQENALKAIVEWSATGKTGIDFYQACTQYLTESLGVQYAFVATTIDDSLCKSLVTLLWTGTEFLPQYEMDLVGTPCLLTYQNQWGIFPQDLQVLFPQATDLANLKGESYLSVVIRDFEGNMMGNLGIIDTKPLPQDISAFQFILQLFADRIAAEMQRHDDEDELRKSQQQIRAFIDNSSAAMYLKDLEGRYRLMNQTCVELSGGDSELFLGETDFAVYPPEIAEQICQRDRELIRSGESITIEERAISPDGVERTYLSNKFVLLDDEGKPYALGGVSTDITDRKQAEEQLNQTNQRLELANQELQRATRLKDEFLATMSHELRTPLNAILGMSESLQDLVFGNLNSSQIHAVSTIEKSGAHLLSLINDILDVSKIAAGKLTLNPSKVALSELCQSSLILVEKQASDKQIQILTQLSVEPDWILVDERRMRQVLINLLNNAVKFTPHGGSIKLAVSVESVAICDLTEGACLCFSVSDTGIGISQADRSKLFQPFVQVDSSLNRKYQGTGLGLVLVKQIVELHGGYIKIDSEVGIGSCFSIMLPQTCWQFQPLTIASTPSQNLIPIVTHQPKTRTILLVEDNEVNVDTFVSYLTAKGNRVIVANTATAAISILENSSDPSQKPDIILMDIQLPDIDGITAIEYIRQHDLLQIPIIALTALVTPGEREKCLAVGADRYLTKPVKLLELHNTIQECLN
ncbi:PAS domain S-box protein [Chamaesiphon sp. VAR_48_metabat_403]|uniref:PAS domain S-box protein n=1 Tax=Chamaesiphon sp. VAR_48_metabat_403 TaxID=2964700 RepID=UPI00286DAFE0|nr:AAA family ATPase [Chamaesiphon sp. VAR_48_metabat_403]